LCKGLTKAIGIAGAVKTQPYQSTGFYQFTLDKPWFALLHASVVLLDQGANACPVACINANVRNNTTGADAGVQPGTDPTIAAQIVNVKFRLPTTGALTDLQVSTGFWLFLFFKRTAIG
jgi:hypothetical protein